MPRLPRLRRSFVWTHRWLSLTLGLVLIAITTSGAVLLYGPEIEKVAHPAMYDTTKGAPIPAARALEVAKAPPEAITPESITPESIVLRRGAWVVTGAVADGGSRELHLDAATGRLLGTVKPDRDVIGWLENFHDCALTCEGYAGYTPLLAKPAHILGNDEMTVGGLILAVIGLMLAWLALTGLVLWWPGIARWARGWRIRRKRGTYALNYDLHKVVGAAAVPFLALWAISGAGFEVKQLEDAWYAVLPGKKPPEYVAPTSKPKKRAEALSLAEARSRAQRAVPGATFRAAYLPAEGDKTGAYEFNFSDGFDPRRDSNYQGDVDVGVDQYSGATRITYPTAYGNRPLAQAIWQDWSFAGHAGTPINGWWRIIWLVFGLSPLLLAVTGTVTWWMRRRKRKAKKRVVAARRPPVPA